MNFLKSFIQLTVLVVAISTFSITTITAQAGSFNISIRIDSLTAGFIKFDGVDGSHQMKEGSNIVGRNSRTGEKLIINVKSGKLVSMGTQSKTGAFKALSPNAAPCNPGIRCPNFAPPKCFTIPGGACVCVCGPWITTGGGRN